MRATFHPEADNDFIRELRRYSAIRIELGQRFYRHINELVAEVEANPTHFRVFRPPSARRHFRRPFPHAVVYVVKPDYIWVLAVMHFKQPPSYWYHRREN